MDELTQEQWLMSNIILFCTIIQKMPSYIKLYCHVLCEHANI